MILHVLKLQQVRPMTNVNGSNIPKAAHGMIRQEAEAQPSATTPPGGEDMNWPPPPPPIVPINPQTVRNIAHYNTIPK